MEFMSCLDGDLLSKKCMIVAQNLVEAFLCTKGFLLRLIFFRVIFWGLFMSRVFSVRPLKSTPNFMPKFFAIIIEMIELYHFFFGSDCNKCSFTKRKWQKLKNMCTWNSRITYIQRVVALLTRLWATTNAHQPHLVSPIVSTCVVLPMRFQLSMSRKTNFVVYLTILFINDVLLGSIAL